MRIRRETFDKHKKGIWLIKLKEDKYLHIPKPKTSIYFLFQTVKGIAYIPFSIIGGIGELLIDTIGGLPRFIRGDILHPFKLIFPNIINVIDEGHQYLTDIRMLEDDK